MVQIHCKPHHIVSYQNTDHDVSMVYKTQHEIIDFIKSTLPHVSEEHYFTDGCTGQYEKWKGFMNLCHHKSDFSISVSWSFFATSHGKSPCDGIGGTVKRIAAKVSLQLPFKEQITTPRQFFVFCEVTLQNIIFYCITKKEIEPLRTALQERLSLGKTIPGTRSSHSFIQLSTNKIATKMTSLDKNYSYISTFSKDDLEIASQLHTH